MNFFFSTFLLFSLIYISFACFWFVYTWCTKICFKIVPWSPRSLNYICKKCLILAVVFSSTKQNMNVPVRIALIIALITGFEFSENHLCDSITSSIMENLSKKARNLIVFMPLSRKNNGVLYFKVKCFHCNLVQTGTSLLTKMIIQ